MPKLGPKRQVTIPQELCARLSIKPGDELDFFESEGRITIIKKCKGASGGMLKHKKKNRRYSDQESLQSAVQENDTSSRTPKAVE